jgi:hypothetical protein
MPEIIATMIDIDTRRKKMTEITNKYDAEKDYFEELKRDEVMEKDGKKFPLLRGLQRLAHNNRGGVSAVYSNIVHTPARDNPIAAATITYHFHDGTSFAGSADATTAAHDKPYNLHLVAVAESKAEARALRRAFNITQVSADEIGNAPIAGRDDGDIEDTQVQGITMVGRRKGLNEQEILDLIKTNKGSLAELTASEGRQAMKALNKVKKVKAK